MPDTKWKRSGNFRIIFWMNKIGYPQGSAPAGITPGGNPASRGQGLEADINDSNLWYRENGKCLVYKKPTPVQVVHVDYPSRQKARITEAYYKTPSTTDYNGVYRGRYLDFEAKETRNIRGFPLNLVHPHQIRHLEQVERHDGIGFFIIRFTARQKTFLVDAPLLIREMKACSHSSIPYVWFEEQGVELQEGLYPRLPWLAAVDRLYF